jgi:hypothetical protein
MPVYTGYLMPYVDEIIAGWNAGKRTGQIRSEICATEGGVDPL